MTAGSGSIGQERILINCAGAGNAIRTANRDKTTGIFNTVLLQGRPDKVKEALAASVPFPKRLGKPDEFAALA